MGYNRILVTGQALNVSSMSLPFQLVDGCVYCVQSEFTGSTCSFTAYIQLSADAYSPVTTYIPPNFSLLANSSMTFTSSGDFAWNVGQVGYEWARLVIVDNSSGTNNGVLNVTVNVKGPI